MQYGFDLSSTDRKKSKLHKKYREHQNNIKNPDWKQMRLFSTKVTEIARGGFFFSSDKFQLNGKSLIIS